jgi:RNA polymerase sigma-70 factor (ECF subfamily)
MPPDASDLSALVERLRQGDRQALGELITYYRDPLKRMIALRTDHRLNGRVSPSDILQEAYLDAQQRVDHYCKKPDMPIFVWLRLIVGQRLIEVHRYHLQSQMRSVGEEISLSGAPIANSMSMAAHLVSQLTSPSQAAMRNEALAQLEQALERLDPLDREVLTLRHFEELSNHETAVVLGIQPGAASKRYVRALGRLRELLTFGLPKTAG